MKTYNKIEYFNKREENLVLHCYNPVSETKGVFIFLHGFNDYATRFKLFYNRINNLGLTVIGFDLPGHGDSSGEKGTIPEYQELTDDLDKAFNIIKSRYSDLPIFICGHGFGGSLAVGCILQHQNTVTSLLLLSPTFKPSYALPKVIQEMTSYISNIAPNVGVIEIEPAFLSRNPEMVEQFKTDPQIYRGKINAKTVTILSQAGSKALKQAKLITLPVWMGHGEDDRYASVKGSELFFNQIGSVDKNYKCYPKAYHDLLHDLNSDEVIQDIIIWLEKFVFSEIPQKNPEANITQE